MNSGQSPAASQSAGSARPAVSGGRFDFDDGGTYCGGWEDGKAHGHGVCTGPKSQGEYSGSWHYGFEVSGVYTWPSGSTYEGHWQNGRRHGLGVEGRGRWAYRGEWTQGFRGRYGVRQSTCSSAKYEGTWANGLQDGYGSETYADSGTYQGQWQRGFRHGYGVRTSAAFGIASVSKTKPLHASASSLRSDPQADLTAERDRRIDDTRGGFVLKARSDDLPQRRGSLGEKPTTLRKNILQGLRLRKQRSTGDLEKRGTAASVRSTASSASWMSMESAKSHMTNGTMHTDSNASFVVEDEQMDSNVNETYMGEWKNDRRVGYGVCERSDGLRYEGEWYNNKKYGYGVTTFRDGAREEGKYKNNLLITSNKKKHLFLIRSAKFRERVEASVNAANRASKIALQKADIAISRTATARGKAEQADIAALHSREDSDIARIHAKQFAPDFHQPGSDSLKSRLEARGASADVTAPRVPKMREESAIHQRSRSMYVARAPSLDYPNGVPPGMEDTLDDASMRLEEVLASVAPPSRRPSETMLQDFVNADPGGYASADGGDQSRSSVVNSYRTSVDREMRERTPTLASRAGARNSVSGGGSARYQTAMSDHFSQYRRPPSRDSSVDRFSGGRSSRQTPQPSTAELGARVRSPSRPPEGLPSVPTGAASTASSSRPSSRRQALSQMGQSTDKTSTAAPSPVAASNFFIPTTPEEAALMTNSNMKRTESVFIAGPQGRRGGTPTLTATTLQRKKSLPDANTLPVKARVMPREEANHLAASRREDIRQQVAEAEMYRANPLLYLFNPRVKEWFSRQRLVMAVILLNVSLALLFIKLMT